MAMAGFQGLAGAENALLPAGLGLVRKPLSGLVDLRFELVEERLDLLSHGLQMSSGVVDALFPPR